MATIVIDIKNKEQIDLFGRMAKALNLKTNLLISSEDKEDWMLGKLVQESDLKGEYVDEGLVFKKLKDIEKRGS